MTGGKPAVTSTAVWGALVAMLAGIAQLAGYTISTDDQAVLVNLIQSGATVITSVASIVGGVIALWGRIRATKQITGVMKP